MIADDIRANIGELRAEAESLMIDTVVFTRVDPDSPPVFDPVTGTTTPAYETVYSGKCQLRDPGVAEVQRIFGEQEVTAISQILSLPHTTTGIIKGDVGLVTSADPQTADMQYRIVGLPASTWAIANNYPVKSVI